MRQHANSFDLVRLIAASLVLWSHQHALMGLAEPSAKSLQVSFGGFGGFGVLIFFAVSGYLNTLSIGRHQSVLPFLVSRALRIYPALIGCVGFTVLLGACVTPNIRTYFDYQLLSFIGKNLTLFTGIKAGVSHAVFAGNVMPNALDGSLWTLPFEVKMYAILAICFALFRYNPLVTLSVSALGLLLIAFSALNSFWLQFSAMFIGGCFIAAVQRLKSLTAAVLVAALLACLFALLGQYLFAGYLLVAAAVVALGSIPLPARLRPPVDLSYAIYLYAFPVQQLSAKLTDNLWVATLFTLAFTLLLAFLSVLFIERPAQLLRPNVQKSVEARLVAARAGLLAMLRPSLLKNEATQAGRVEGKFEPFCQTQPGHSLERERTAP